MCHISILITFLFLHETDKNKKNSKGKGGDGQSDARTSTERSKSSHHKGGWVRGHHKDGGGYAKEMPKYITGKDIGLLLQMHTAIDSLDILAQSD